MKRNFILTIFAAFTLAALTHSIARAQSSYTITELRLGYKSSVFGINASGQVAGSFTIAVGCNGCSEGPFALLWTPTASNGVSGQFRDLGGGSTMYYGAGGAYSVNASGQVAVWWYQPNRQGVYYYHALLYSGSAVYDLGTLKGGKNAVAYAINSSGEIAGWSDTSKGTSNSFLWKPGTANGTTGTMYDLSLPAGPLPSVGTLDYIRPINNPYSINSYGQIVGPGFVWTPSAANGTSGSAQSLGGYGINDFGQVVGSNGGYAALWTPSQPNSTNLSMVTLTTGVAYAINTQGQVVGVDGNGHPFLWSPSVANGSSGSLTDLTMVPLYKPDGTLATGWILTNVTGINDSGQIIGEGTLPNTGTRFGAEAFLMTPR